MKKKEICFYDLTNEDLKGYAKEYFKTPGGKRITVLTYSYICLMILLFVKVIIDIIIASVNTQNYNIYAVAIAVLVFLLIYTVIEIYYYSNFYNYLKRKHNISRW